MCTPLLNYAACFTPLFPSFPWFVFSCSEVCKPSVQLTWSNNALQISFPKGDIPRAGRAEAPAACRVGWHRTASLRLLAPRPAPRATHGNIISDSPQVPYFCLGQTYLRVLWFRNTRAQYLSLNASISNI